jgi:hypothetical protein
LEIEICRFIDEFESGVTNHGHRTKKLQRFIKLHLEFVYNLPLGRQSVDGPNYVFPLLIERGRIESWRTMKYNSHAEKIAFANVKGVNQRKCSSHKQRFSFGQ